jgi:hypothetical protein
VPRRTQTMKDVATLRQLFDAGQLLLAPEFQRDAVWPRSAKAYLIDTILNDRPIPYLYFRRSVSAQTGRSVYEVIDGQQRLRAIFEYLNGRFGLTESKQPSLKAKRYQQLTSSRRAQLLSYDVYIEELTSYSDADIRDMFLRMNRFVVKLSQQEIRHARFSGKFADLVESLSNWTFWKDNHVFTPHQLKRMRAVEFVGELVLLLIEGPQDKKAALDLYYGQYERSVPFAKRVQSRLRAYLDWIAKAVPDLRRTRFRKPTHFYAIVGALETISESGRRLAGLPPGPAGKALKRFDATLQASAPTGRASRYLAAASRQTDNVAPRLTRIQIIADVIREA